MNGGPLHANTQELTLAAFTCTFKSTYSSSPSETMLSSVTLYIMEGSRETFSMNIGEVVMFWI